MPPWPREVPSTPYQGYPANRRMPLRDRPFPDPGNDRTAPSKKGSERPSGSQGVGEGLSGDPHYVGDGPREVTADPEGSARVSRPTGEGPHLPVEPGVGSRCDSGGRN